MQNFSKELAYLTSCACAYQGVKFCGHTKWMIPSCLTASEDQFTINDEETLIFD